MGGVSVGLRVLQAARVVAAFWREGGGGSGRLSSVRLRPGQDSRAFGVRIASEDKEFQCQEQWDAALRKGRPRRRSLETRGRCVGRAVGKVKGHRCGPFCRAGREETLQPSGTWPATDGLRAARPDAHGRSIGTEARRAGLLAYGSWRPRTAFPPRGSGVGSPGAWPNTAAAPRRIRTVFPILPQTRDRDGGTHREWQLESSRRFQVKEKNGVRDRRTAWNVPTLLFNNC